MSLKTFQTTRLGKRYQESPILWYQCVSLIKKYLEDEYNFKKAKAWNVNELFVNKYNYFPSSREQVRNDKSNIKQVPPVWSIVVTDNLFDNNPYWHIGICTDSWDWYTFKMLQQNGWSWAWNWLWDNAILEKEYNYNYVLWRWKQKSARWVPDIWNWDSPDRPATRREVAQMIERYDKLNK